MSKMLYALDFDGVICDSAVETGLTGWKVAIQLWPDMPTEMPEDIQIGFRDVRPVMETGFEAILIVRLLFEGQSAESIRSSFADALEHILNRDQLAIDDLKSRFGETRDAWIKDNLADWIAMNPLFNGIADKIRSIAPQDCVIITTKQERFVHEIFAAHDLSLPAEQVYGLDRKLSKQTILSNLLSNEPNQRILFVEDRLPTLINVINDPRLDEVELYFADWGYNTSEDKLNAAELARIKTINLSEMWAL
jgi:phosphoglycolate phosphatase-like HAD superfamily hydrolase